MSLLFSTEKLFTNDSIELLTKQNDKNKKIIYELKCENAKLMERINELEKGEGKKKVGSRKLRACYGGVIPEGAGPYPDGGSDGAGGYWDDLFESEQYTYNQVRDMIDVKTKSLEEELANYKKFEYQIENHEYEYCNYGTQWRRGDDVCYRVAGGGLSNGNAYAEVERVNYIWYYCEYGKHPSRSVIGTEIVWSNEIYRGDDPYECRNFDILL